MNGFIPFAARSAPRDPRAVARAILSQPRFRVRIQHAPPRTWWDAVRDWLGARWNQLADAFAHHVRLGRGTSVAAGDALIAIAVLLVIAALIRLLLSVTNDRAGARAALAPLPPHPDPQALHASARRAAASGDYARAAALLFQAALAVLDARGILRDDPSRTVNECRSDVRRRAADLSSPFDVVARTFTAAVYAEDLVTQAQWLQAQRAYERFAEPQRDAA